MTSTPDSNNKDRWDAAFDAAREFIQSRYQEDGCVVGIGEVLEHLDEAFGKTAGLTSDVGFVLNLITWLWEDTHIDRVPCDWIDFCWNEAGSWPREKSQGLRARLLGQSDPEELS